MSPILQSLLLAVQLHVCTIHTWQLQTDGHRVAVITCPIEIGPDDDAKPLEAPKQPGDPT